MLPALADQGAPRAGDGPLTNGLSSSQPFRGPGTETSRVAGGKLSRTTRKHIGPTGQWRLARQWRRTSPAMKSRAVRQASSRAVSIAGDAAHAETRPVRRSRSVSCLGERPGGRDDSHCDCVAAASEHHSGNIALRMACFVHKSLLHMLIISAMRESAMGLGLLCADGECRAWERRTCKVECSRRGRYATDAQRSQERFQGRRKLNV